MDKQVLSAEQMQILIDMGIDVSKASICWLIPKHKGEILLHICTGRDEWEYIEETFMRCPTFTLQDILEIIPVRYGISRILDEDKLHKNVGTYELLLQDKHFGYVKELKSFYGNNLLELAFEALKWCRRNNYI